MGAQHHHLVRLVGPGNLRHDVEHAVVLVMERVADVHLEGHPDAPVDEARDAVVVLRRDRQHRRHGLRVRILRAAAADQHAPAIAPAVARLEHRGHALLEEERVSLGQELARIRMRFDGPAPAP